MGASYSGLRIAGLIADSYACGHYRMVFPLTYLRNAGADIAFLKEASTSTLAPYDIVVAQRQTSPVIRDLLKWCRREGKTVISEQDDLMHNVPNLTDSYNHYKNGAADLDTLTHVMRESDGITTSTIDLAYAYSQYSRNVKVLPNCLDFDMRTWPVPAFNEDRCVIGWAGSPSHIRDIQLIGPAIKQILEKYKHVTFAMACDPALYQLLVKTFEIPIDRTLHIMPVPFDDYPAILPNFDIGLCPIENTAFNRAKSNLKALEYSGVGVPYVASKVAPYQRHCLQGVDGFIADATNDWVKHLSTLIEDTQLRKTMGAAAYTRVREDFNYATKTHLWVEAWTDIRFASKVGDVGPGPVMESTIGRNDPCLCGSGVKYKRCPNNCYPAFGT